MRSWPYFLKELIEFIQRICELGSENIKKKAKKKKAHCFVNVWKLICSSEY